MIKKLKIIIIAVLATAIMNVSAYADTLVTIFDRSGHEVIDVVLLEGADNIDRETFVKGFESTSGMKVSRSEAGRKAGLWYINLFVYHK